MHEPARLSILTALEACHASDFVFLQSLTGLSGGNLSTHLSRLEQAGLVKVEKTFKGKVPRTLVQLTASGRSAIQDHWRRLEMLRKAAGKWRRPEDGSKETSDGENTE